MRILRYEKGGFVRRASLWEALLMPGSSRLAVSLTGGGGKTSIMYRLSEELEERGKRVIVTTATHILRPLDYRVVIADRAQEVEQRIGELEAEVQGRQKGWILVTGQAAPEGKLSGLLPGETAKLSNLCDVLLIEADGAKRMPVKVPRDGEPVILPETEVIIGCAGLDCIGHPMEEVCFRIEEAEKLLGKSGKSRMTPEDVAIILTSREGTRKNAAEREYRIVLNKADREKDLENAAKVLECIRRITGEKPAAAVTGFGLKERKH